MQRESFVYSTGTVGALAELRLLEKDRDWLELRRECRGEAYFYCAYSSNEGSCTRV